jgi:hypothetical protein
MSNKKFNFHNSYLSFRNMFDLMNINSINIDFYYDKNIENIQVKAGANMTKKDGVLQNSTIGYIEKITDIQNNNVKVSVNKKYTDYNLDQNTIILDDEINPGIITSNGILRWRIKRNFNEYIYILNLENIYNNIMSMSSYLNKEQLLLSLQKRSEFAMIPSIANSDLKIKNYKINYVSSYSKNFRVIYHGTTDGSNTNDYRIMRFTSIEEAYRFYNVIDRRSSRAIFDLNGNIIDGFFTNDWANKIRDYYKTKTGVEVKYTSPFQIIWHDNDYNKEEFNTIKEASEYYNNIAKGASRIIFDSNSYIVDAYFTDNWDQNIREYYFNNLKLIPKSTSAKNNSITTLVFNPLDIYNNIPTFPRYIIIPDKPTSRKHAGKHNIPWLTNQATRTQLDIDIYNKWFNYYPELSLSDSSIETEYYQGYHSICKIINYNGNLEKYKFYNNMPALVQLAIMKNPNAFKYAHEDLQKDIGMICFALKYGYEYENINLHIMGLIDDNYNNGYRNELELINLFAVSNPNTVQNNFRFIINGKNEKNMIIIAILSGLINEKVATAFNTTPDKYKTFNWKNEGDLIQITTIIKEALASFEIDNVLCNDDEIFEYCRISINFHRDPTKYKVLKDVINNPHLFKFNKAYLEQYEPGWLW